MIMHYLDGSCHWHLIYMSCTLRVGRGVPMCPAILQGEGQLHHAAFFTDRAGGVRMLAQQRPTSRRGAPGGHVRALMATSDRCVVRTSVRAACDA